MYYMRNPQSSYNEYPDLYMANEVGLTDRKARLGKKNSINRMPAQAFDLDPFQKQMILENERYLRQLMLQRDREEARRRRIIEQNAYGVLGSTAGTAGKHLVNYLFV